MISLPRTWLHCVATSWLHSFINIMNIVTINENVYHEHAKFCQLRQNTSTATDQISINIIRLTKFIKLAYYILESREYVHCVVDIGKHKMHGFPSIMFWEYKEYQSLVETGSKHIREIPQIKPSSSFFIICKKILKIPKG